MRISTLLRTALAVGALAATPAAAATVKVVYDPREPFAGAYGSIDYHLDGDADSALAGPIAASGDPLGDFIAWCIEIDTTLKNNKTYRMTSLLSAGAMTDFERLFRTAYAGIDLTDPTETVAFQTAVWEIASDGGGTLDLGDGVFALTTDGPATPGYDYAAMVATATGYLSGLDGPQTGAYDITYLRKGGTQNLVTAAARPGGPPAAIPLPAAGWMLAAALGALIVIRPLGARR